MTSKAERHTRLLEIIRRESIGTQSDLAERLQQEGIACTQASVSRDIRELGLVKRGGVYMAAEEPGSGTPDTEDLAGSIRPFLRSAVAVGEHLVVVHTVTGTANSVGMFMDQTGWPGLVGTVAGDDTIFAAVEDRAAADELVTRLQAILEERQ